MKLYLRIFNLLFDEDFPQNQPVHRMFSGQFRMTPIKISTYSRVFDMWYRL